MTSDLKQQISKYKYKNENNKQKLDFINNTCSYYLYDSCKSKNEYMFFFLIRHGVYLNKENNIGIYNICNDDFLKQFSFKLYIFFLFFIILI